MKSVSSFLKAVRRAVVKAVPIVGLVLGLAPLAPLAAQAQFNGTKFFAAPTRAFGATNNYVIVPAVGDRVALVRTLECVTDLTAARVTVFTNGARVDVPYDVTSSNIQVSASGTNGMVAGDNILIHIGNTPNDYYHRVRLVTVSTTNLLYTPTLSQTISAGSGIYKVGTNTFHYGMTNGLTSPRNSFVAVGQRGQPMLIDLNTGAAGALNAVGTFESEK